MNCALCGVEISPYKDSEGINWGCDKTSHLYQISVKDNVITYIDVDLVEKSFIFCYSYSTDDEEEIEDSLLKSYALLLFRGKKHKRIDFFSKQIKKFEFNEKELHADIQKYLKKTIKLANFT